MSIDVRMGPLASGNLIEASRNPSLPPTFASACFRLGPHTASRGVGVFWGYFPEVRNLPIPPWRFVIYLPVKGEKSAS